MNKKKLSRVDIVTSNNKVMFFDWLDQEQAKQLLKDQVIWELKQQSKNNEKILDIVY